MDACNRGMARRIVRALCLISLIALTIKGLPTRDCDGAEPAGAATHSDPSVAELRATIQRSIPFIEERGTWWIENKKCVSCHRVGTMVWSLSAAQANGLTVSDRLTEWRNWSLDTSLKTNDKGKLVGSGNLEGLAQLVLSRGDRTERADDYAILLKLMVDGQQENGLWSAGGQLPSQKRPKPETNDVSSMWIAMALTRLADGLDEPAAANAAAGRAIERLAKAKPGASTEWLVTRLLLAHEVGDAPAATRAREALIAKQHEDGGWGWLVADPSDALATGMSLYALSRTSPQTDSSIRAARKFLLDTQQEDGSWPVYGTKANKKGKVEETATYWGTTWAALGLLESLRETES